jgi:arylsulfatase A-like enzyme
LAANAEDGLRPNILFVVADDLGWSDVGWHNGFARTPNMDKLVREGIELDQHYVQPVCTPTRAASDERTLSGTFWPTCPGTEQSAGDADRHGDHRVDAQSRKVTPHRNQANGTWGRRFEWGPNHFGFDHGYGTLTGAADPWTHKYRHGVYEDTWHRDGKPLHEEGNATELIAAEAIRRIEEKQSPWFVYVPFHAVHTPVDAPDEFKQLYAGVRFHDDPPMQDSRLRMAAMVSQLDAKIGQFIEALERTGQRDNTLVVFTSDNGGIESLKNAYVGDVGDSPLNSENDPLRGQKNTLYEGGTRVCAFANWPGKLAPRKLSTPMHVADWMPTISAMVGFRPETDLQWDGVNQWPHLSGAETCVEPRTIYIAMKTGHSIRHGDWKLIVPKQGEAQLFNIAEDPYETSDVILNRQETAAELRRILTEHQAKDQAELPADLVGLPG